MSVEALIFRDIDRAPRVPIDTDVTVRGSSGHPVRLSLVDLSQTGFLIESDVALDIDEHFSIGISGIAVHGAIVRRVEGNHYGCEFLHPLSVEELAIAGSDTVVAWPGPVRQPDIGEDEDLSEAGAVSYDRFSRPVRTAIYTGGLVLSWIVLFALLRIF